MENNGFLNPTDKLVLIVDDEKGIRDMLEIIVRKEGFRVELSGDGDDGLKKARTISPDIILLDLMLPKEGGYEILRELQNDETGGIPIIIMTARILDRTTIDMFKHETNVREFIEKPLKQQVLVSLIHQLLKTRPPIKRQ